MAENHSSDRSADAHSRNPSAAYSRRSICRGIAVMALPLTAGCSNILGGNPGEVTVFNDTGSTVSATVTVTNVSEETTALSETTEIESSQASKFNDVFDSATQYRFEVETEDGLSGSHEWDLPSTDHYLYVTIHSDSIEFEENEP